MKNRQYIDVLWIHGNYDEDPYRLVSELDSERFEIRKLEYFKNGVVQYADEQMQTGDTYLGLVEVPDLQDINNDSEFEGKEISKELFEKFWNARKVGLPTKNLKD